MFIWYVYIRTNKKATQMNLKKKYKFSTDSKQHAFYILFIKSYLLATNWAIALLILTH